MLFLNTSEVSMRINFHWFHIFPFTYPVSFKNECRQTLGLNEWIAITIWIDCHSVFIELSENYPDIASRVLASPKIVSDTFTFRSGCCGIKYFFPSPKFNVWLCVAASRISLSSTKRFQQSFLLVDQEAKHNAAESVGAESADSLIWCFIFGTVPCF